MARPSRRSNRERREQSTEQVLAAALKLFVSRGYTATSIDDIAKEAGLTKGAVYFYFKGKSALILELLVQSGELYQAIFTEMQRSGGSAIEQLEQFVDWAAQVGAGNNALLLLPILVSLEFYGRDEAVEKAVTRLYDRFQEEMERVVVAGQTAGDFNPDLAPREQAAVLVAFTDGMLLQWFRRGSKLKGSMLVQCARSLITGATVLSRNT